MSSASNFPRRLRVQAGFTAIELILVIVLIGILSAFVSSRIDLPAFAANEFTDRASSAIAFARKLAIAQRSQSGICLQVSGNTLNACSGVIADPATGGALSISAGSGVSVSVTSGSSTFTFDSNGGTASAVAIKVDSGSTVQYICVAADSGYVSTGGTCS